MSNFGSLYIIKSEEFLAKMGKDQQTWQMLLECAKISDESIVSTVKKATKDVNQLKKVQAPFKIDDNIPDNEFSIPEKNYLTIIDDNNLKMTDDRIADFRKTISELVGVKNGVIPADSQNMFRSSPSKHKKRN